MEKKIGISEIQGNIVDVVGKRIFKGTVVISQGKIAEIREEPVVSDQVILPGLIDAHIHIESSMLIPSEFARLAVVHGTVATVSDPHEIANVLGIPGIMFMLENGKKVPFKFNFGASSCVPATGFETAGATLGHPEIAHLLELEEIRYLSEMMNFPGVLYGDPEVKAKIDAAKKAGKPVDGHAPGLMGEDARKYIEAGISTDHECFTLEEALEKLKYGMKILIREGSAARNFEALSSLIKTHPHRVMLCSDDKHPDDLVEGHINELVLRSIQKGYDIMDVLRSCTYNPVTHYKLPVGLLQKGDPADLIVVSDLTNFLINQTYINGILVADHGTSFIDSVMEEPINQFSTNRIAEVDLLVLAQKGVMKVQQAIDGQLITRKVEVEPVTTGGTVKTDPSQDILKLVVKTRYQDAPPAMGFVQGFGLKRGAIASCVAHDSHNIVAVGADDKSIARAINLIVKERGGISFVDGDQEFVLPLPFAGIMTDQDGYHVGRQYAMMDRMAKNLGSPLRAPYMTLSFMALLVIPELKLSDKGLFDGEKFSFVPLFG